MHISQWVTLPTQSCLVLYSFYANLLHSLIMWLIASSLSPHSLHLLFCWVLWLVLISIIALIWLVLLLLLLLLLLLIIIIIIIISLFASFSYQCEIMVFHWSLRFSLKFSFSIPFSKLLCGVCFIAITPSFTLVRTGSISQGLISGLK